MDTPRAPLSSVAEWVAAAALVILALTAGSAALREARTAAQVTPVIARDAAAQVPTGSVPAGAVSVPVLLLPDADPIHVGDPAAVVLKQLSGATALARPSAEQGPHGPRITHNLDYAGQSFVLVIEAPAADRDPAIAAIYLR
jgi:hypothetical protein